MAEAPSVTGTTENPRTAKSSRASELNRSSLATNSTRTTSAFASLDPSKDLWNALDDNGAIENALSLNDGEELLVAAEEIRQRAKNRVTLVTSFKASELDLERTIAEAVRLLHQYLQYIESGGTNLGDQIDDAPILNPFEVDVRDTLAKQGLRLVPQYGSSGYRIDFAVRHPLRPEFVMALECDGATYHSSESARDRDRLRQDQLERLGWRFCRIWSSEWFYDRDKAVEKVLEAYEKAVKAADAPPPAAETKRVEHQRPEELKVDRFEADAVAEQVK